jgi:predicted nucleic acid-binding protein
VRAVLDSTVLADMLRGHPQALDFVLELTDTPTCSEVTRVEIIRRLRSFERSPAERWFAKIDWIPLDEGIARRAGELGRRWRGSHPGIGTPDLIVAATAEQLGVELATHNVRHFPMFEGLRPPYRSE